MSRRGFFWGSLVLWVGGALLLAPNRLTYCAICFLGGIVTAIAEKAIFGLD